MSFRISGLDPRPFAHLFGLPEAVLRARGVRRNAVDRPFAFPDRVELRDADVGETVLLLNYTHQPDDGPYRASHAIFVRQGASVAHVATDEIPDVLARRTLSLRAFDAEHMIANATLVDGVAAASAIEDLFGDPSVAYIHAHYATRGCYAARIDRA